MENAKINKEVLWLILGRSVIITMLVIAAIIIQFSTATFLPLGHFYALVLSAYLLSLVYSVLYATGKNFRLQVYIQIFCDLLLITGFVYISGGLQGSFYFLYIFEVIIASVILSDRAAYLTALLSSIFFALLVDGLYLRWIPSLNSSLEENISTGMFINNIIISWGAFFLVAFLMNRLMKNFRGMRTALQRAQKEIEMRKYLSMAGEISANLAHEIRNPLAAVSGSVQVLRDEVKLDRDQKNLMDIIVSETHRVSQIIDQFLNLAASGGQPYTWVNLSGVLDETLTLLRRSGEINGNLDLGGNYQSANLKLYGNKSQFKQIFWNLIRNSLKAMPEGGKLTIDFLREKNRTVLIKIKDTGIGMTKEVKENLFQPFCSGFEKGVGIGMSVVGKIVDEYQGRISVSSERERGTEVSIIFPQKRQRSWT